MSAKVFTEEIEIMVSQILSMHFCKRVIYGAIDCYVRIMMNNNDMYTIPLDQDYEKARIEGLEIIQNARNQIREGKPSLTLPQNTEYHEGIQLVREV